LRFLVSFGVQLWMYGSPIAYPLSEILGRFGATVDWLFLANPIAFPIEMFRFMLFQSNTLRWSQAAISLGFTIVFFFLGVSNFHRVQQDFMDRI
jgi:lipopolysaccharide transport system permease protein